MKGNRQSLKRFLAILLSTAMIVSYMPTSFFAYARTDEPVVETTADDPASTGTQKVEAETTDEAPAQADEPAAPAAPQANETAETETVTNPPAANAEPEQEQATE